VVIHLARIIHGGFYCNRRYVAATRLTSGGLAAQSVNILFQVAPSRRRLDSGACLAHSYKGLLPASRLRAPVSLAVSAVSSRTRVNNAGRDWEGCDSHDLEREVSHTIEHLACRST
jgi:hypothetical protein